MDPLTRRPIQETRNLDDADCFNRTQPSSELLSAITPMARPEEERPCASSRESTILFKTEESDFKPKIEDLDFEFRVKIESLEVKKEEPGVEESLCPSSDHHIAEGVGFVEPLTRLGRVHNAIHPPLHEPNAFNAQQSPVESQDPPEDTSQTSEEQQNGPSLCPTNERRRCFMEAVELPPPRFTLSRPYSFLSRTLTDTAFEDTMENMKNPKALERQSSGPLLNLPSIKDRMVPIGLDIYLTGLDQNITETYFSRYFISSIWGGNPHFTFPRPTAVLLQRHGLNDWMFITLQQQPHAPQVPGAPGLYFSLGHEQKEGLLFEKPMRVITRIRTNAWQYLGQYNLTSSKRMTKEEWEVLPMNYRKLLFSQIRSKARFLELRADIYLRKQLYRPPTWDEIGTDIGSRKDKNFYARSITIDDMSSAVSEGLQPVGIYSMKCVSYDKTFAQNIHKKALESQQEKEEEDRKVRKSKRQGEKVQNGLESKIKRARR